MKQPMEEEKEPCTADPYGGSPPPPKPPSPEELEVEIRKYKSWLSCTTVMAQDRAYFQGKVDERFEGLCEEVAIK